MWRQLQGANPCPQNISDMRGGKMDDLISRQAAIALADTLKDDLPDDERIADAVIAHNEGVMEYQTKLSLLPSAQPERKKGKWINDNGLYKCSSCKQLWAEWWVGGETH